jgi:GT2 family glycosyltransferase
MVPVDVVVVSYRSRDRLRGCVEPLAGVPDVHVTVVDNASPDGSLEVVDDLPVTRVQRRSNGGFAVACNEGWRLGGAPYVLFLNPDARIDGVSLRRLVGVLEDESEAGIAGPLIRDPEGHTSPSQRRFTRLRHLVAYALFLHRLLPGRAWVDDVVRAPAAYAGPASPEWLSGACLLVRRELLERLGGFDERFFLYAEDADLCRRVRGLGFDVRFEPTAEAVHEGGASAARSATLPLLARSRAAYAAKHLGRLHAGAYRLLLGLGFATHALSAPGRRGAYARAVRALLQRA